MNKIKPKSIVLIFFILIITSLITIGINNVSYANSYNFEVEEQTTEFYVNDFAGVFSEEQKQDMVRRAVELDSSHNGIQVVVTTINSLDGHEIEEYAHSMYDQYGIGKDSMGILILLSVSDRDVRIETGYKMQGYFTDSMSGRILDQYGMEYFRENKFAEGLSSVQSATISKIQEIVPSDWETNNTNSTSNINIDFGAVFSWIFGILFGFLVLFGLGYSVSKLIQKCKELKRNKIELIRKSRDVEWQEKLKSKQEDYDTLKKNMDDKIEQKDNMIYKLEACKSKLESEVSSYEEKFERIEKIHPNIEEEIRKHIEDEYRQKALEWDNSVRSIVELEANENNIDKFDSIIESYNRLSSNEKTFVKTDINAIKEKYQNSIKLKDIAIVGLITTLIENCCNKYTKGDYSNYEEISEVYKKYDNLTDSQKNFFTNKNLIKNLTDIYNDSKQDNDNYNEAKEVEKEIKSIFSKVGRSANRNDVNRLKKAKRSYERLSEYQTKFIDQSLYDEILRKLKQAQADDDAYERRQEEERIARNNRISSSGMSSFSRRF